MSELFDITKEAIDCYRRIGLTFALRFLKNYTVLRASDWHGEKVLGVVITEDVWMERLLEQLLKTRTALITKLNDGSSTD